MTRHKKQPTADAMREQLRLAADEIIRLKAEATVQSLFGPIEMRALFCAGLVVGLLLGWVTA